MNKLPRRFNPNMLQYTLLFVLIFVLTYSSTFTMTLSQIGNSSGNKPLFLVVQLVFVGLALVILFTIITALSLWKYYYLMFRLRREPSKLKFFNNHFRFFKMVYRKIINFALFISLVLFPLISYLDTYVLDNNLFLGLYSLEIMELVIVFYLRFLVILGVVIFGFTAIFAVAFFSEKWLSVGFIKIEEILTFLDEYPYYCFQMMVNSIYYFIFFVWEKNEPFQFIIFSEFYIEQSDFVTLRRLSEKCEAAISLITIYKKKVYKEQEELHQSLSDHFEKVVLKKKCLTDTEILKYKEFEERQKSNLHKEIENQLDILNQLEKELLDLVDSCFLNGIVMVFDHAKKKKN